MRPLPFWSVSDAAAGITRLLEGLPEGPALEAFLPPITASPLQTLRYRAAVASTFVSGLELTRHGRISIHAGDRLACHRRPASR